MKIQVFGPIGVAVTMAVVFFAVFLATSLAFSGIAHHRHAVVSSEKAKREVEREKETIRRNLEGLTGWQRHFVARFLLESRTQIPESDVGGYRMVWGDEVQVLINKGIIREHRNAGVYEIEPKYHDYLKDHLDRDTGALV